MLVSVTQKLYPTAAQAWINPSQVTHIRATVDGDYVVNFSSGSSICIGEGDLRHLLAAPEEVPQ